MDYGFPSPDIVKNWTSSQVSDYASTLGGNALDFFQTYVKNNQK